MKEHIAGLVFVGVVVSLLFGCTIHGAPKGHADVRTCPETISSPHSGDISHLPVFTKRVDLELYWRPERGDLEPGEYTFYLSGMKIGDIRTLKRYIESLPADSLVHPWYNEGRPRAGGTPDFRKMGLDEIIGTNRVYFGEVRAK